LARTLIDKVQLVYVIDDDELVCETLVSMLETLGYQTHTFEDGVSFLHGLEGLTRGVVLIDVNMPKLSGIQVSKSLHEQGYDWPVIVMSGQADISMAVDAMKHGAHHFIEKPFVLSDIAKALGETATGSNNPYLSGAKEGLRPIEEKLSQREIQVLRRLVEGEQNKVIARNLDISHRTVEVHRANIMRHLEAESFAELVKIAISHGIAGV